MPNIKDLNEVPEKAISRKRVAPSPPPTSQVGMETIASKLLEDRDRRGCLRY